jgi:hypothetical protein
MANVGCTTRKLPPPPSQNNVKFYVGECQRLILVVVPELEVSASERVDFQPFTVLVPILAILVLILATLVPVLVPRGRLRVSAGLSCP